MTTTRRKRLIEVAFPLEEVSAHSRREKNVRHGHISTLHIWWARRPLAACRAFIYASLVDDPDNDAEREELLKEVADLSSWDAVRHPDRVVRGKSDGGSGLTGTELLERARRRILDCNGGKPPKLLDPFAGGGAIPLEGLRLGCEVEASDLNPVAVLILKGTVEYPQKYGQPDSRPVPDYIHRAAEGPAQGRFTDDDLVEAYRRNPWQPTCATGATGCWRKRGRNWPSSTRQTQTAACRWPTCGAAPSPAPPATPRCPSSASTGWPARTRKRWPWSR